MDKNDIIDNTDNNGDEDNERTKISFDNSNKNCKIGSSKSSGGIKSCQLDYLVHPLDRNIAGIFILTIFFTLLAIVSGFPIVLCLFILLPIALVVRRVCVCCMPSSPTHQKIEPLDSLWLNSGHITHCLLYIDKGLSVEQLRDVISTRLLSRPEFMRFRSRLLYRGLSRTPFWKLSNTFDTLDEHIIEDDPILDRKCLRKRLKQLMSQSLPSDKPLWQIRYAFAHYCNQVVLIVRVHQSLSQSGLVSILVHYLSDNPPPQPTTKTRFGGSTLPINIFRAVIVGPLTYFLWIVWAFTRRHNNYLRKSKNKSFKSIYWTSIDLPRVYRVKQVTRSTLNDLIVSIISGSVRAYLTSRANIFNPPDLNISIPIDIRPNNQTSESGLVGVNYVLVTSPIPTNTEGAIPRLWEVRHLMEELKTSADTAVMYGAHYLFSRLLPLSIYKFLLNVVNRNSSLFVSNISGPENSISIGSYRLNKVIYFMSAPSYCSVTFNVFSFDGKLYVSICSTSQLIPSAKSLMKLFVAQLNRLSILLSRRRVPGESRRRRKSHIPYESPLYVNPSPDGVVDLTNKLHEVQYELHKLSEHFDSGEPAFIKRYEELKDEFTGLLFEMRRRKSIADHGHGANILINIEDEEDDDNDGELRPPPPRRFSVVSIGRRASTSFAVPLSSLPTSTSRVTPPILSRRGMTTSPEPPSSPEVAFKSETEC